MLRDDINLIFVNLSRRLQALTERQLSLIDRLEQDPDQLASLFELDHLATRMRRTSESLLVLSGAGLSRQLSRPVPASDVVGAAVSEVQHYARIEVASVPDVAVQGPAVSDLVHVIAELLDNATFFSQPESKVIVRMAMTRKKELAIQITDQGVGMSEDEIGATNARLADPPDLDVAVTRRMGLYVVARLAKRHNITVRLRNNNEGGITARINVPAELVRTTDSTIEHQLRDAATSFTFSTVATPPMPGRDDAPTERLPIYEAVLSRWFEVTDSGPNEPPEEIPVVTEHLTESDQDSRNLTSWFAPPPASTLPKHEDAEEVSSGGTRSAPSSTTASAEAARRRISNLQLGIMRGRRKLMEKHADNNSSTHESPANGEHTP